MTDLVERSGDLKVALVRYGESPRFAAALRKAQRESGIHEFMSRRDEVINFMDSFLLQHRLPDGLTVLQHFVNDHPELPEEEKAMLLGWSNVVEGIFEVKRHEGETLILDNLIDDLIYRARSNIGGRSLRQILPGYFLLTRLVPVGDEWVFSGMMSTYKPSDRKAIYRAARDLSLKRPQWVFRNPEKLEQAWKMQQRDRQDFIAFFGSDMVVVPKDQWIERNRAYMHYKTYEVRDEEGKTPAEKTQQIRGSVPPLPEVPMPDWDFEYETIGMVYDEHEGQGNRAQCDEMIMANQKAAEEWIEGGWDEQQVH